MMGNMTARPTHRSRALAALTLAAGMALSVAALAPVSVAAAVRATIPRSS